MNTEDVGRDLMAVEQLQRKQEALERDMTAIEGKLKVSTVSTDDSKMSLSFFVTVVHIDFPACRTYSTFGCENSFLWSVIFMCRVSYCELSAQMS
jgi:hypothetical protein